MKPGDQLQLSPALGEQPLRSQHHHDHEQEAEDAHLEVSELEVEPEVTRQ